VRRYLRLATPPFRSPGNKQGRHSQNQPFRLPGVGAGRRSRCEHLAEVIAARLERSAYLPGFGRAKRLPRFLSIGTAFCSKFTLPVAAPHWPSGPLSALAGSRWSAHPLIDCLVTRRLLWVTVPETIDPPIPDAEDWDAVQTVIAEVQQAQRTIAWNAALVLFWDVAVRAFRIVERKQLFEQTPADSDLKIHQTQLDSLIKLGQILETRIQNIDDEDLGEFGVGRANLSAYVRELQDTFLTWHGPVTDPTRAAELEKKIFGATSS
jgi:hypothetical protein